ncbi:hypothetical protein P0D73_02085 [Paraburkholderia sp. RL18-101-BIB-B]|uniref:hypothetical protein n=1 Tax=Paraburkholderia sp. RL18-101-BIB-B TaxID=3031634 RepID=UPI0038BE00C5
MHNPARRASVFSVYPVARERAASKAWSVQRNARAGAPHSAWRAMQSAPLSVLASNESEHAHVLAVAILGYN